MACTTTEPALPSSWVWNLDVTPCSGYPAYTVCNPSSRICTVGTFHGHASTVGAPFKGHTQAPLLPSISPPRIYWMYVSRPDATRRPRPRSHNPATPPSISRTPKQPIPLRLSSIMDVFPPVPSDEPRDALDVCLLSSSFSS